MLLAVAIGMLAFCGSTFAETNKNNKVVNFGQPPWPAVTVKNQVAAKILETLGYDSKIRTLSPSATILGIATGEVDVYLAGWMPMEAPLINPRIEAGKVIKLVANLPKGAIQGIAVPTYVWEAGIHSVADMAAHADKFDHKIYGLDAGSGFNVAAEKAIEENKAGLGDWTLVSSSTAGMLAQVSHSVEKQEWIAFGGWRPHWMNLVYDMKYLKDSDNSEAAGIKSVVYTVTRPDYAKQNPNLGRFFKQFIVTAKTQSKWIAGYSHEDREPDVVAREWLRANTDKVKVWLDGVKTTDGQPGFQAFQNWAATTSG